MLGIRNQNTHIFVDTDDFNQGVLSQIFLGIGIPFMTLLLFEFAAISMSDIL